MSAFIVDARAQNRHHDVNGSENVSERSPLLGSESTETGSSRTSVSAENAAAYHIPPADHGKAAWLFLAGCFFIEGLVWG